MKNQKTLLLGAQLLITGTKLYIASSERFGIIIFLILPQIQTALRWLAESSISLV